MAAVHSISDSDLPDDDTRKVAQPAAVAAARPRKRRTKEEVAAERAAKAADRAAKQQERLEQRERSAAMRPGECLRFVEASVEAALVENRSCGAALLASLRSLPGLGVRVNAEAQLSLPLDCGLVRWRRREALQEEWQWEPDLLLILSSAAFLDLSTGTGRLDPLVRDLQAIGKPIVIVMGKVNKKTGPSRGPSRVLTLQHWQETVVRLQLDFGVTGHLVDEPEELGRFVRCLSKSVAERRIKEASRSADAIFGTSGASTVSVRVTEEAATVSRLWRQQLLQLRLVTGEVADALVAAFPTPRKLADAMAACEDAEGAQRLVADVEVRRGAGLLQTRRRVGKEAARRLWTLMTHDDPDAVIR